MENYKSKNEKGFSLVELMVVVGMVAVLIAMTGSFSIKAGLRRSVDSLTTRVANELQTTKLRAARGGVEYRTRFVVSSGILELITERGDSNTDSTIWTTDPRIPIIASIKLDNSVVISNMPSLFEFNPNGTAGPPNNFAVIAESGTGVDRCGKVTVSSLGRISVIQGHWDGTKCRQVADK